MSGAGLHIGFRASTPDHDQSIQMMLFPKPLDIVYHLFGKFHLVLAGLDVWPLQPFNVFLTENGSPRLDFFDLGPHGLEQVAIENPCLDRAFVAVIFVNVPAAEDEVIQGRERNKVMDFRNSPFRAFSQPDGSKLGQRTHRLRNFLLYRFHPSDKRRTDGTQSGNEDTQFSGRRFDLDAFLHHTGLHQQPIFKDPPAL